MKRKIEILTSNETAQLFEKELFEETDVVRQKSEFFANASHELKTPITVMRGLAELLLQEDNLNEKERKQLERIHKESVRMTNLVSDMLKISKLERGEETDERAVVEWKEIAEEVVAEFFEEIRAKNLKVKIKGAGKIAIDPKKAFELLQNLCGNAVHYNKENGWLEIVFEEDETHTTVSVKDGGIGIEEEHLPRLCERFYRVDKSRSKKTGGTGLGLSIVKHICVLYGASLTIESEFGEGTEVTVRFQK